jgi:glycosyltransferase involved in cell wall biosynthesis
MSTYKTISEQPHLVFVRCMTFNHEAYIEDALNGFVMQQTNFPFVVAIINDASTDKTKSVINEFIENNCIHNPEIDLRIEEYGTVLDVIVKDNPHCIFHIVHLNENHHGKKSKLPYFAKYENAAKYVAMCEGDDYWTDPLKLQKQVDFMEANPDYSMCFHGAEIKNETLFNTKIQSLEICNRDYSATEVLEEWIVPTASILYKKDIVNAYNIVHPEWILYGDIILVEKCCHVGKVFGMSDKMSVYRMQNQSMVHNPKNLPMKIRKMPNHYECLRLNFNLIDRNLLNWLLAQSYYSRFRFGKEIVWFRFTDLIRSLYYNPSYIFNKIFKNKK